MTPAKSPGEIPGTDVPEKLRYCIVICYQRNLKLNMLNIENETLDLGKRSDSWFNSEVAIGANVFFPPTPKLIACPESQVHIFHVVAIVLTPKSTSKNRSPKSFNLEMICLLIMNLFLK